MRISQFKRSATNILRILEEQDCLRVTGRTGLDLRVTQYCSLVDALSPSKTWFEITRMSAADFSKWMRLHGSLVVTIDRVKSITIERWTE